MSEISLGEILELEPRAFLEQAKATPYSLNEKLLMR